VRYKRCEGALPWERSLKCETPLNSSVHHPAQVPFAERQCLQQQPAPAAAAVPPQEQPQQLHVSFAPPLPAVSGLDAGGIQLSQLPLRARIRRQPPPAPASGRAALPAAAAAAAMPPPPPQWPAGGSATARTAAGTAPPGEVSCSQLPLRQRLPHMKAQPLAPAGGARLIRAAANGPQRLGAAQRMGAVALSRQNGMFAQPPRPAQTLPPPAHPLAPHDAASIQQLPQQGDGSSSRAATGNCPATLGSARRMGAVARSRQHGVFGQAPQQAQPSAQAAPPPPHHQSAGAQQGRQAASAQAAPQHSAWAAPAPQRDPSRGRDLAGHTGGGAQAASAAQTPSPQHQGQPRPGAPRPADADAGELDMPLSARRLLRLQANTGAAAVQQQPASTAAEESAPTPAAAVSACWPSQQAAATASEVVNGCNDTPSTPISPPPAGSSAAAAWAALSCGGQAEPALSQVLHNVIVTCYV